MVVDCANGATYRMAPDVFRELGANVMPIGVNPDGLNINLECGSTHPGALRAKVLEVGADLGVAFDGDGDRVIMVDHQGEIVDGDELLYIIAAARHARQTLSGGVVGTLMSNFGLELALRTLGIEFVRAAVGDRYVMEHLTAREWQLGGESSGHIVCLDRTTTGDGIVSALQVLEVMIRSGRSLADLKSGMSKLPQVMINVRLASRDTNPLEDEAIRSAVQAAEAELAGCGRVLLRSSGTEPLIRVMVEGESASQVKAIARGLADEVERRLA
jgi:phosphoglucosamine mutase